MLEITELAGPLQLGVKSLQAWTAVRTGLGSHGGEWVGEISALAVSIATVLLWRSTQALSRSTNLQQTTDGPFLNVVLYPDNGLPGAPVPTLLNGEPIQFGIYDGNFLAQDAANPQLNSLTGTGPPSYVNLIVYNRASKPSSIAANVKIKTLMLFGANSVPNHPFEVRRDYIFTMIGPGSVDAGRLYNINGVNSYQIQILEVSYSDIMGRDRRAASGVGNITQNLGAPITALIRVFEPRKGEYTDAVH